MILHKLFLNSSLWGEAFIDSLNRRFMSQDYSCYLYRIYARYAKLLDTHQLNINWQTVWFKTSIFVEISELWFTNKIGHISTRKDWASARRCCVGHSRLLRSHGEWFHPPWLDRRAWLCSIFLSKFQLSLTSWEPLNTSRLHHTYVMYVYKLNWPSRERLGVQFSSTKSGFKTCILA